MEWIREAVRVHMVLPLASVDQLRHSNDSKTWLPLLVGIFKIVDKITNSVSDVSPWVTLALNLGMWRYRSYLQHSNLSKISSEAVDHWQITLFALAIKCDFASADSHKLQIWPKPQHRILKADICTCLLVKQMLVPENRFQSLVSFYSTVINSILMVKNEAVHFMDFANRGFFLKRNPRDKRVH